MSYFDDNRALTYSVGVIVVGGVIGYSVVLYRPELMVLVASIAGALLAYYAPEWLAAVAIALQVNVIPGVNANSIILPGGVSVSKAALIVLFIVWARLAFQDQRVVFPPLVISLLIVSLAGFVALRMALGSTQPLIDSIKAGSTYGYYLEVFPIYQLTTDSARFKRAIAALLVFGVLFEVGYVLEYIIRRPLSFLVHPYGSGVFNDTFRAYAAGNFIVDFVLLVSLVSLYSDRSKNTATWWTVCLISMACGILQFGRMNYAMIAIGLGTIAFLLKTPLKAIVRWSAGVIGLALVSFLGAPGLYAELSSRFSRAILDLVYTTGTWGYRMRLDVFDINLLARSGRVFWGFGFLLPGNGISSLIPGANLQNTDLGFVNMLMTGGIVELALVVCLTVSAIISGVRLRPRGIEPTMVDNCRYASIAFLTGALLTSVTLVNLSFGPGIAVTSLCIAVAVSPRSIRWPSD